MASEPKPKNVVVCDSLFMRMSAPSPPRFIPKGWLTIPQAIELVGKQLYGERWDGTEKEARPGLPPLTGDDQQNNLILSRAGKVMGPAFEALREYGLAEWVEVEPLSREAYQAERESFARLRGARDWLWQRLWGGELTALWPDRQPVPAQEWGSDNFTLTALREGTDDILASLKPLFVVAEDLERLLRDFRSDPRPTLPSGGGPRPAELRLEAWLARRMKEVDPKTTSKAELKADAMSLDEYRGKVSGRGFERAWSVAVKDSPAFAGVGRRKRKSPH